MAKINASEIIQLQRDKIAAMEKEQEWRNKSLQFYFDALFRELSENFKRVDKHGSAVCAYNMRVLLGQIRESKGKPFALPGDENCEHLP